MSRHPRSSGGASHYSDDFSTTSSQWSTSYKKLPKKQSKSMWFMNWAAGAPPGAVAVKKKTREIPDDYSVSSWGSSYSYGDTQTQLSWVVDPYWAYGGSSSGSSSGGRSCSGSRRKGGSRKGGGFKGGIPASMAPPPAMFNGPPPMGGNFGPPPPPPPHPMGGPPMGPPGGFAPPMPGPPPPPAMGGGGGPGFIQLNPQQPQPGNPFGGRPPPPGAHMDDYSDSDSDSNY